MERVILHCDLNGFYASVETLYHPEYRNYPLAVGGHVEDRHGIILAKNELAKKYHIQTGETLNEARKKCPNLVIIPPDFSKYLYFSKRVRKIFADYTEYIEPFGIDEAWLDVTGCKSLFGDGKKIADTIRQRIIDELGVTASVGVSYNKIFAKLGSDYKKPNATTVITKENKHLIVDPLPVEDLLYVGRSTKKHLENLGVHTIGELARCSPYLLKEIFGKNGVILWKFANGYDDSPVERYDATSIIKSIGNSVTTRRDLVTRSDISMVLYVLCESVASRLRDIDFQARKISIYLRDNELKGFVRQMVLPFPTCLAKDLWEYGMYLFDKYYDFYLPLRSIGIRGFDLVKQEKSQLALFPQDVQDEKELNLEKAIDDIREKFGCFAVRRASMLLDKNLTDFDPKSQHVIFPESYFR